MLVALLDSGSPATSTRSNACGVLRASVSTDGISPHCDASSASVGKSSSAIAAIEHAEQQTAHAHVVFCALAVTPRPEEILRGAARYDAMLAQFAGLHRRRAQRRRAAGLARHHPCIDAAAAELHRHRRALVGRESCEAARHHAPASVDVRDRVGAQHAGTRTERAIVKARRRGKRQILLHREDIRRAFDALAPCRKLLHARIDARRAIGLLRPATSAR